MLCEVFLQLADERALVRGELLPVTGGQIDGVLVWHVDPRDRDGTVLVHLLGQLAGKLDGLHVCPERPPEDSLEEALDLALDAAQDAHSPGRPPPGGQSTERF